MGRDKATLVIDGATLAARAASLLSAVAAPCVEVGPGVSGLASVREDPPGQGPLTAVVAGVGVVGSAWPALVVACDLPRLGRELLCWLRDHPSDASVVPLWEDRPQPLCARWSPSALSTAGGLVADNVIIGWDRHPELPLFGVNAATRAQLLQDFTQALVVRNSQDVVTRGNVTRADQDE